MAARVGEQGGALPAPNTVAARCCFLPPSPRCPTLRLDPMLRAGGTLLTSVSTRHLVTYRVLPRFPCPQLADFLVTPMERAGGMMPLPDAYCLYNRARGTELVSPDDLTAAVKLFPKVGWLEGGWKESIIMADLI